MNREQINFSKENQVRSNANRSMSFVDAVKDTKMSRLGEGAGVSFSFIENEVIYFPTIEEAFPFTKKFRDTEILYISGYSEKRGRFVEIPLATFRKRPAGDGELDEFYDEDERPLNCRLAEASTDLDRFRILCEVGAIECTSIKPYHAWIFETDADGKVHRTDRQKPLRVAEVRVFQQEDTAATDTAANTNA